MEAGSQQRALVGNEQWLIVKGKTVGPWGREGTELLLWPERATLRMTGIALIVGIAQDFMCLVNGLWKQLVLFQKGCPTALRSMRDDFGPWGGNRCWG